MPQIRARFELNDQSAEEVPGRPLDEIHSSEEVIEQMRVFFCISLKVKSQFSKKINEFFFMIFQKRGKSSG